MKWREGGFQARRSYQQIDLSLCWGGVGGGGGRAKYQGSGEGVELKCINVGLEGKLKRVGR